MRTLWIVLMLVPLAGCLAAEDGPRTDSADLGDETQPEPTLNKFAMEHTVVVQQLRIGGTATLGGSNCIMIPNGPSTVYNGTIEATWTAQTPLTSSMQIIFGGRDRHEITGTSPLTLSFDDVRPRDDGAYLIVAQVASGSASLQQAVDLDIQFEYPDSSSVQAETGWSCAYG